MSGPVTTYPFRFARSYRLPALALGITPATAVVTLDDEQVAVRFGLWRLRTPLANVREVRQTGGFAWLKTAGPPHLSLADRGVSFATNGAAAACVLFHEPVRGIDPTGVLRHPGMTVTVADPALFADDLRSRAGLGA